MTASELEYRIKLNMLRIKYSNNSLGTVSLCIDSAISAVEFAKEQYRAKKLSKLPKGGVEVGSKSRVEVIITPECRKIPISEKDMLINEGKEFIPYKDSEFYKKQL